MTTVICIDANSKKGRPTGLQFLRRYEIIGEEAPSSTCVYCGQSCDKIDVGVGGGGWCRRRFALAFPGNDIHLQQGQDMIPAGTKVKVRALSGRGSDAIYSGRIGIVKDFDPSLGWGGPRALLAPEQYICVHFVPRTKTERKDGSPMALLMEESLSILS